MIDSEFEDQVLAKSLRDIAYLKKSVKVLEAHHFSTDQHSWVWSCVKRVFVEFGCCCSAKLLIAFCKKEKKEEEREPFLVLASKLYRMDVDTAAAALAELTEYVRLTDAQLAIEKAAKALERGKTDEVYEIMRAIGQKDIRRVTYTGESWIEGFEARQAERKYRSEHPEEFISIPTGFKKLDSIIGGVGMGELALVLGSTGRGKSIFLNNIAYNAICRGFDTVYFGFEMPARQIAMRQDSRWLGIEYKKFKNYDFTDEELKEIDHKLRRLKKKFERKFKIRSLPVRSGDMNTIRAMLDDLENEEKFVPKLIIFDSLDHLKPIGRGESTRLDQAEIYWLAKGLMEERGAAGWSSTQVAKEFANKIATAEAASESYDKARISDLMVSINEPTKKTRATKPVDDDDGEWDEAGGVAPAVIARGRALELFVAKFRDGESKVNIPLDADFSRMLIRELSDLSEE